MGFCKELLKPKVEAPLPRVKLTPEERAAAEKDWLETELLTDVQDLQSSVRLLRIIVVGMALIIIARVV